MEQQKAKLNLLMKEIGFLDAKMKVLQFQRSCRAKKARKIKRLIERTELKGK